jgi:hypothetical protein
VPPPPVGGAAVGNELADRRGVGDGLSVAGGESVPDTVTVGDAVADTAGLALALEVAPLLTVLLATALAVAEPVTEGEKMAGAVVDEDPEQAESATEPSTVKAPRPAAVSLALSTVPAMVVRTFMEPPHRPGRWRPCFRIPASETFPDPGRRNRQEKETTQWPDHGLRRPWAVCETLRPVMVRLTDGAGRPWRVQHRNIRLRE